MSSGGAVMSTTAADPVQEGSSPSDPVSHPLESRSASWGGLSWVTILGLVLLTSNAAVSIFRSLGDVGALTFVASAYLNLVALFFCVRAFKQTPPNSRKRNMFKRSVWLLTTSLLFEFLYEYQASEKLKPTLDIGVLVFAVPAGVGIAVIFVFFDGEPFGDQEAPGHVN